MATTAPDAPTDVPSNSTVAPVETTVRTAAAPIDTPRRRTGWKIGGGLIALLALGLFAHWLYASLGVVSTDDAYVNGHVTFVAPRVAGQVMRVLVEDNNRVRKGDLLAQLDREPYEVQRNIAQSAVATAEADLVHATSQTRAMEGQARSLRFALEHAIQDVDNQVALLRSRVATLQASRATLARAQADYNRALQLVESRDIAKEEVDTRREALAVAQARVEEALQGVYQIRVALGQPPQPTSGDDLAQVPADLNQTFSTVRQAQASLIQAAAQLGVSDSFNKSPKQLVEDFYKRDPQGDIDRIYNQILKDAPAVKQAEAKVQQAKLNLAQAELNLRYCDIFAEIDGVVTRREVNPGNNVVAGQSLMAIRSLTDIWVDANFKETQLAKLRIGHPVDLDVDMYGGRRRFKGRISGFTMGTGSTLALLPPQNATGNFVKVVQRLPVRVDLVDYDPERAPLFVGLSVTPSVWVNETPAGPNAGQVLQPDRSPPAATTPSRPETRP